jgi:hypothetical protein
VFHQPLIDRFLSPLLAVLVLASCGIACNGVDRGEIEGYWECTYQAGEDDDASDHHVLVLRRDPWNGLTGLTAVTREGHIKDPDVIFDHIRYREQQLAAVNWAKGVRFEGVYDAAADTLCGLLVRESREPRKLVLQRFTRMRLHQPLVPDDFVVPQQIPDGSLQLRRPALEDAEQTYSGMLEARIRINNMLQMPYPPADYTLAEERARLQQVIGEYQRRKAFHFLVTATGSDGVLGEVAVRPVHPYSSYDAQVFMWLNDRALAAGRAEQLRPAVEHWLDQQWPFERVVVRGP